MRISFVSKLKLEVCKSRACSENCSKKTMVAFCRLSSRWLWYYSDVFRFVVAVVVILFLFNSVELLLLRLVTHWFSWRLLVISFLEKIPVWHLYLLRDISFRPYSIIMFLSRLNVTMLTHPSHCFLYCWILNRGPRRDVYLGSLHLTGTFHDGCYDYETGKALSCLIWSSFHTKFGTRARPRKHAVLL